MIAEDAQLSSKRRKKRDLTAGHIIVQFEIGEGDNFLFISELIVIPY